MAARRSVASDARDAETTERTAKDDIEMKDEGDTHLDENDNDVDMSESALEGDGPRDMLQLIAETSTYLCEVEEDGEELAAGFQRIPNRRVLPDYFEVIAEPVAFSTVRGKVLKKQYTSFPEFVKDVAQICHNAQVYNRPSAPIFGAAVRLREVFKEKLADLAEKGAITADEAVLPDLGELPPVEDSPQLEGGAEVDYAGQDDEDDEDEDEDEEDEDDDDSDDEGRGRRGRRGRRSAAARDDDFEDDSHKKRGRPPTVLTPVEGRISTILKELRKSKAEDGSLLVQPFERLPDRSVLPDYYQTIMNPIALDQIKKNTKRKKYQNVDQALADLDLMFNNAKAYNEDDSPLYRAAVELQKQAHGLAMQEKARPDEDFRDEDGRLPLTCIEHKGDVYRVGDWVHIRNANDLGKPIVVQIYRTWQARDGHKWINACWYYRPEQTVHRYDKHFLDHEVFKTSQYRDHQIEDVEERCFVMFVTRFNRGRPRGFPRDKAVYVCESRYNEEKAIFNKINTWASCVPDEVRDKDYEMDMFPLPHKRLVKQPSPIKHLLREDAKEADSIPRPTWGSANAPPIVGAVHRRPRGSGDSPPPEPVPPAQQVTAPSMATDAYRRGSMTQGRSDSQSRHLPPAVMAPGPSPSPSRFQSTMPVQYPTTTPMANSAVGPQHSVQHQQPHQPNYPQQTAMRPIQFQQHAWSPSPSAAIPHSPAPQQMHTQPSYNTMAGYSHGPQTNTRAVHPQSHGSLPHIGNTYNPPRPPEVYTLPDATNEAFSAEIRQQFKRDEADRILFFSAPPLVRASGALSPSAANLGHSAKYLLGRSAWLAEREKKRKLRDQASEERASKRSSPDAGMAGEEDELTLQASKAVLNWFGGFEQATAQWRKAAGLDDTHKTATV
ncbi:uncharacterized protein J7T54_001887 [Emericellopsis cladophorae]|uniref:RSC complex subunit (RSC1) n=1 Tax=Emericellopsis cladophorae TaxID=2686198 RepID=A0A9P9XX45_9HYPO|nr:uncharacterized protein J7T54_001887 [Emericellopsis cladophorae]KAI6779471.1 hypothetical protein J7T54_001887 [Emericellopsis cladophorae]